MTGPAARSGSGSDRVHRYYTPQTMAMFHEKYDDAPLNPLLNEGILHGVSASGHPYSPRDRILYLSWGSLGPILPWMGLRENRKPSVFPLNGKISDHPSL